MIQVAHAIPSIAFISSHGLVVQGEHREHDVAARKHEIHQTARSLPARETMQPTVRPKQPEAR
jgi:hypothetical protein